MILGVPLTIDDPRVDVNNPSCLSPLTPAWQFTGSGSPVESSLTLFRRALLSNRTYQFKVHMENRRNASIQATGYVLVQVEDTPRQMVVVS